MANSTRSRLYLGIFVVLGAAIFLGIIYYLANREYLFTPTIEISATFRDVSGLKEGNMVRYSGIEVGTIKEIEIVTDTTARVWMLIEEDASQFIKKNATVTIASVGLMGNKFLSIIQGTPDAPSITEGDELATSTPVDVEDVLRVLEETGTSTSEVARNLAEVSERITQGVGLIGKLVYDTTLANNIEQVVMDMRQINEVIYEFKAAAQSTRSAARDISAITSNIREGEGLAGRLISDEGMAMQFQNTLDSLEVAGNRTAQLTEDLNVISSRIRAGEGTAGRLLNDTSTVNKMDSTLVEMQKAAQEFQRSMKELRGGWLFRLLN